MFYSFDTIEKMGYKYVADFVSYMVKVYRYNCSIQYADNGVFIYSDFDSQEGVSNMGEIMTEQRRKDAIEYIMGQLEDGYIDLGLHDQDELMIVEEAMELLIVVEKFNSIPTVNPISSEDLKKVLERSNNDKENYA